MTKEAYEMLMEILAQRADEYEERGDHDTAWTYGNVREMVRHAQHDDLECLRQYYH